MASKPEVTGNLVGEWAALRSVEMRACMNNQSQSFFNEQSVKGRLSKGSSSFRGISQGNGRGSEVLQALSMLSNPNSRDLKIKQINSEVQSVTNSQF